MDPAAVWPQIRKAMAAADYARCEALLAELGDNEAVRIVSIRLATRQDRPEAARDRALAFLADYPPQIEVCQLLARAAHKLKDWPLAASASRQVAELAPGLVEALRQTALAHARLGNDAFSLTAAERLAGIADTHAEAFKVAAATLLDLDRFERLASLIAQHAGVEPDVFALVESFADAGEWRGLAAALAGLRAASVPDSNAIDQDALIAHLQSRGAQRERDGLLADALNDFRAILVVAPNDMSARDGVARLTNLLRHQVHALTRIGEFGEALDSLRILYRHDPTDRETASRYGHALFDAGEFGLAADLWRATIAADPDFEEAYVQLARSLEALDRPIDAIATWRALFARWPDNDEASERCKVLSQRLYALFRDAIAADDGVAAARYLLALPAGSMERSAAERSSERIAQIVAKAMRTALMARNFGTVVAAGSLGSAVAPDNTEIAKLLRKATDRLQQVDIAAASRTPHSSEHSL